MNDPIPGEKKMIYSLIVSGVPETLAYGLMRYFLCKLQPGHFLTAILENDLVQAKSRADPQSKKAMPNILLWLVDHAPSDSWGSRSTVSSWLESKAIRSAV